MVVSQYLSIHLAARLQSIFYPSGLIIHACIKRYTAIHAFVVSLPGSYRLSTLSSTGFGCIIICSYLITVDIQGGIELWKGWADDHYAFSAVGQFPAVVWMNDSKTVAIQVSRFFLISDALLFFSFFGLTKEVRELYRNGLLALATKFGQVCTWICEACLRQSHIFESDTSSPCQERDNLTLPVSTQHKLTFRHDLIPSFSPNFSLSNVAFDASDFVITLANKEESDSSIEFSSEISTLPHTPSSDQSVPNSPMPPTCPEPPYVDVRDSKGSRALAGLPSDNIV
jgi:pheromone a factor receptor